MLFVFRLLFLGAAILCAVAAILVTASLFIADRAPQSSRFLAISLGFSVAFLGLGWLTYVVQNRIAAIAAIAADERTDNAKDIVRHLGILVIHLVCAGALLCLILASLVYAILARIDQGFAVFG